MATELMKLEVEAESCCVCGSSNGELLTPEEHDASAPVGQVPLRAMLLQLSNCKVLPDGRLCAGCVQRTLESYEFSSALSSKGVPPLSEKIRALRRRLHELTQKIDVFIVVGGPGTNSSGAYSEDDIIMVDKAALAAAAKADDDDLERARNARGDTVYQCTICPASFQRVSEFRSHSASHGGAALHSCWTCGAQFSTRAALSDHAAQHCADSAHCHLCDTTFQSVSALRAHESSCAHACGACGMVCASRAALSRHASGAHGAHADPPHVCALCYRVYCDSDLFAAHQHAHRNNNHFLCGYDSCILRFPDRSSLMAHIRKSHASQFPEPPQQQEQRQQQERGPSPAPGGVACSQCPRTFGSVAALKRHARVHRNDAAQEEETEYRGEEEGAMELDGDVEYLEVEELDDLDE